jgi:hypothetical protein
MPSVASAAFILDLSGKQLWIRSGCRSASRRHDMTCRRRRATGRSGARVQRPARADQLAVFLAACRRRGRAAARDVLAALGRPGVGRRDPLPDLREFQITARSTDMVEDAALWMLSNRELVPDGRVAIGGVSFSAGLALVAAGRPSLDGKLQFVLGLGAHHDLLTVLTYLCDGVRPGGIRPPHIYGVAVLLAVVDKLVPPAGCAKDALAPTPCGGRQSDPRAQTERRRAADPRDPREPAHRIETVDQIRTSLRSVRCCVHSSTSLAANRHCTEAIADHARAGAPVRQRRPNHSVEDRELRRSARARKHHVDRLQPRSRTSIATPCRSATRRLAGSGRRWTRRPAADRANSVAQIADVARFQLPIRNRPIASAAGSTGCAIASYIRRTCRLRPSERDLGIACGPHAWNEPRCARLPETSVHPDRCRRGATIPLISTPTTCAS